MHLTAFQHHDPIKYGRKFSQIKIATSTHYPEASHTQATAEMTIRVEDIEPPNLAE